ncbi:hypothetical protein CRUP_004794 [Coryphaenoides rupestris]|nr:hypothetical protein CRUP_004794 [Coryphaenoides rupestris]
MEYPMAPFLTIILLTFATELISNVTLRVNKVNLVEFNDSAVFNCSVSSGSSLSYRWTNNNTVVTQVDDGVHFSDQDAVLTIANVSRYNGGPFLCQVMNGKVISPMMAAYKTGSNITLSCQAESFPTATVQWFFNEMDLGLSDTQITLQHAKENQTGYYKCLFHNAVTSRFSSVKTMIRILSKS